MYKSKVSRINLGQSNFAELINESDFYVDKTMFIAHILDDLSTFRFILRPKRFGKTLNMSMLKYYFDVQDFEENELLFKELKISKHHQYSHHQGKYVVISLSFLSILEQSFQDFLEQFKDVIEELYNEHDDLLKNKKVSKNDNEYFKKIINRNCTEEELMISLEKIVNLLYNVHQKNIILLIDEYDTPICEAYTHKYQNEVFNFFRRFFSFLNKDNNKVIKFVIFTGIQRTIAEDFSSDSRAILPNSRIYDVFNDAIYHEDFGLTTKEALEIVDHIYESKDIENQIFFDNLRRWYGGYKVYETEIFNLWAVLNCVTSAHHGEAPFEPFWAGSSSDNLFFVTVLNDYLDRPAIYYSLRDDFRKLCQGEAILKTIKREILFSDLKKDETAVWSFLVLSGFLQIRQKENDKYVIGVNNKELRLFFEEKVSTWFLDEQRIIQSIQLNYQTINQLSNAVIALEKSTQEKKEYDFMITMTGDETDVDLSKLFDKRDYRVFFTVEPEMRKRALCQYLCYEWALARLWSQEFFMLFWVPLGNLLNYSNDESTIFHAIHKECVQTNVLGEKEIKFETLEAVLRPYLQVNSNRVLYVLNGLDDVIDFLLDEQTSKTPQHRLIQSLLIQPSVIVTAGPNFIQLHPNQVKRQIGHNVQMGSVKDLPSLSAKLSDTKRELSRNMITKEALHDLHVQVQDTIDNLPQTHELAKNFVELLKVDIVPLLEQLQQDLGKFESKHSATLKDSVEQSIKELRESLQVKFREIEALKSNKENRKQAKIILKSLGRMLSCLVNDINQFDEVTLTQIDAQLQSMAQAIQSFSTVILTSGQVTPSSPKLPTCFISYAWGTKAHKAIARQLHADLTKAGIRASIDIRNNQAGSNVNYFLPIRLSHTVA